MESETSKTAIVLFAHGSRVEAANEGVRALAKQVQDSGGFARARAAFLELGQPDLKGAIAEAVEAGFQRIIVVPYFLTLGVHLQRDLPELLARENEAHPGVQIIVSESLEGHPAMPSLVTDRIRAVSETGGPLR
ncbi:MAG TPA: CbiX/SirB N-terminal domain-containing protein [Terriglobia bacterium]|nr:CbiX/SirB N-terminal domain-containing protein [Terriglobia bacterium]